MAPKILFECLFCFISTILQFSAKSGKPADVPVPHRLSLNHCVDSFRYLFPYRTGSKVRPRSGCRKRHSC